MTAQARQGRRASMMTPMLLLCLVVIFCISTTTLVQAGSGSSSSDKCASSSSFYCPNCGGMEVTSCLDCDGYLSTDLEHEICFDRRLFQKKVTDETNHDDHYHFLWYDLAGTIMWFLTAGIATACGVGGGGIYVPLGNLLLQFAPKPASGLSQASIFGASLGGILLNARLHHPVNKIRHDPAALPESDHTNEDGAEPSQQRQLGMQTSLTPAQEAAYEAAGGRFYTRPLINFDMALFLSPMEMAGAVLGVLIQKILPNWLYLLLAALVLGMTAKKTYTKYLSSADKERKAREAAEAAAAEKTDKKQQEAAPATTANSEENDSNETLEEGDETAAAAREEEAAAKDRAALELRKQYLEEDMNQFPRGKICGLAVLWAGLFIITLMKGGKGVDSIVGITCESPVFSVLIVLQFLWLFGFSMVYGWVAYSNQAKRVTVGYAFLPGDPVWDMTALKTYGSFTFLAGIVAGLIGIGGGMVLGPLMLVMGIDPRVSTATTATMIVLTSSSVAVMFVTSGLVPWSYAIFFFTVCFCGAYVGKSKIDGYIKKTGRASLLILILATIIAVATVGCLVILITRLADKDWCFDGFNEFCSVSEDDDGCIEKDHRRSMMMLSTMNTGYATTAGALLPLVHDN